MKTKTFVTQWVLDTVKKQYQDDIALVVGHSTLRIDAQEPAMSYFVPITDRGRQFAQTFILEGIGCDIWCVEWERLEQFAQMNEYNITVLADAQVLYARTPEDRARFEALQKRLAENLADPVLMRANALEAFQQAKQIYFEMLFAKGSDAKMGAGYVLDYLARAVCFQNCGYFHSAQTDQIGELRQQGCLPDGFAELYREVIYEKDVQKQKQLCYALICLVETVLSRPEKKKPVEYHFQDLADWYGELSYTWLRLRNYSAAGDVTRTYMWGAFLQTELNTVCEDFGLEKMELMDSFDPENLQAFASHANMLEQQMRQRIVSGGGVIREYASREEFLHEI